MSLQPYSQDQIFDRLRFENPWWRTGVVDEYYRTLMRRSYFDLFWKLVDSSVRRAIVLMGPRRVGKTVLMYQSIDELLQRKTDPLMVAYISVETPIYSGMGLEEMFTNVRKSTGKEDPKGWYVFFDEIQYLKNWEVHLKSLVDSYPHSRFIVSGSAAAALKLKSNESGAGRFTDFMLPPLTFDEYIRLKSLGRLITPGKMEWGGILQEFYGTNNISELNDHFMDYINFGGYPEVVFSDEIRADPGRYIRSDIIDKVLLRDLPSFFGIRDVQELNSLFTTIAYNSGNETSLEELHRKTEIDKNTIKRYIEYLEAAFLIKIVNRITNTKTKFKRMNYFKIYLTNPSLRSALFSPMKPTDASMGNIVETTVFAQWMHHDWLIPYYARWTNGEVDMVSLNFRTMKPQWAVEIKWSNRYFDRPADLRSLVRFCRENKLSSAIVTTLDKEGKKDFDGLTLFFVPSAVYAYTVGRNTLTMKRDRGG